MQITVDMCNRKRHLAGLVLARGGSKGIPRKNIKILSGIPLIGWTLRAAIDAKYKLTRNVYQFGKCFDSVWVSTDDEEIASISKEFGALVHFRSAEFAGDNISSCQATLEFLNHHEEISDVGLLQCTSPCVQPSFLKDAATMLRNKNYDSIFSVCRKYDLRWTRSFNQDKEVVPLNFDPSKRPRRQDWAGELVECGMFYFFTRQLVCDLNILQGKKCGYIEIPDEFSLDIDSYFHWIIAEAIVPKYGYRNQEKPNLTTN